MVVPAFVRNSFSLWMRLNASHYGCSLNVLTVRRYIVDDLRGPKIREDSKTPAIPEQPATKLSYKGFVSNKLKKLQNRHYAYKNRLNLDLMKTKLFIHVKCISFVRCYLLMGAIETGFS